MKSVNIYIFSFLFSFPVFGQIKDSYNRIRSGDEIIKQQVEYVNPGESGINCVWDFSQLNTINSAYSLLYSDPPLINDSTYIMGYTTFPKKEISDQELIVGTEHNTMYYYRLKEGVLYLLGHENSTVKLEYITPRVIFNYPLNYGDKEVSSAYQSEELYSSSIKRRSEGTNTVLADAYGKLVLPTGDTLSPVLRVKSIQRIGDTLNMPYKAIESYCWYTKGYRYPVFETIKCKDLNTNKLIFATAFYYPIQEQFYIKDEVQNDGWNIIDKEIDRRENIISLKDIMTCRIYPNPVETTLNLEYELKVDAKVTFELYTISGNLIKATTPKFKLNGSHKEQIDCSAFLSRNYVLRIIANKAFANEVIIKK